MAKPVGRRMRGSVLGPLLGALLVLAHGAAFAQGRFVIVNGQLLGEAELAELDALNCGEPVPDGIYWLDLQRGLWGIVGEDGAHPLPDCGVSAGQDPGQSEDEEGDCESRYPVHEDRMCYCYGVC
jgi:hypothetical protein